MSASREEVQAHALDTISEWIHGYSCPETGPQKRFTLVEYDNSSVTVRVETMNPFPSDEKRFSIALTVTEVPPE